MSPAERHIAAAFPRTEKYGRNYAKASVKPGVLAFRNETRDQHALELRSEKMTIRGRAYKLVSYCGGDWEVYRIEDDNFTETFCGYARDMLGRLAKGTSR